MLRDRLGVSERWACRVTGQHRSTERYEPKRAEADAALRAELRRFSAQRPRWGYRRAHHHLCELGWDLNRKRVARLWREVAGRARSRQLASLRYATRVIEAGEQAPDFALPDQDGRTVELLELRGRPVVLYFYPKASTPGCTTQACGVRDHRADYAKAGAVVLGVSPDSVAKVKRFHDEQDLNFSLLADEDHAVAERYGVWTTKTMYGRSYLGNERTTFIIDPTGKIVEVLRKVKPAEHDHLVLGALSKVASPSSADA